MCASRSSAGYSGTPLARKLGFRAGWQVYVCGAPDDYALWLEPLPDGVPFTRRPSRKTDLAHVFVSERAELDRRLRALRRVLKPDATVWVSWPKQSSGLPTTVTENTIRELALPLGFVDVKVCAVSDVWSGLKLTVRRALR